jgi:hypothetical protein
VKNFLQDIVGVRKMPVVWDMGPDTPKERLTIVSIHQMLVVKSAKAIGALQMLPKTITTQFPFVNYLLVLL